MLLLRIVVLLLVLSSISVVAQPARFVVDPPPGQCVDRKNIEFTLEILDPDNTEILHVVIDTDNILIGVANTEVTQTAPNTLFVTTSVIPPAGEKVYLHVAQLNKQTGDTIWYTDTYFSSGEKNGRFLRDGSKAEGYGAPVGEKKVDWKRDGDFEMYGPYLYFDGAVDYDESYEASEYVVEGHFSGFRMEQIHASSGLLDSNQFRIVGIATNTIPRNVIVSLDGLNRDTAMLEAYIPANTFDFFFSPIFRHMNMIGLTLDSNDNYVRINPIGDSLVAQPLQAPGRTLITAIDQSVNGGFEFLSIEEGVVRFVDFNGKQFKDGPILAVGPAVSNVHQADFDNNGRVDYIIHYESDSVQLIMVDEQGVFRRHELGFTDPHEISVLDLDGDRIVDFTTVATTETIGLTGIMAYGRNESVPLHFVFAAIGTQHAWIDYNNDGVLTGANAQKKMYWDHVVSGTHLSLAEQYTDSLIVGSSNHFRPSGYTPMDIPGSNVGRMIVSEQYNHQTYRAIPSVDTYHSGGYTYYMSPKRDSFHSNSTFTEYLYGYNPNIAPVTKRVVFEESAPEEVLAASTDALRTQFDIQPSSIDLVHTNSKGVTFLYLVEDQKLKAIRYDLLIRGIVSEAKTIHVAVSSLHAVDDFNLDGLNDYVVQRPTGEGEIIMSDGTLIPLSSGEEIKLVVKADDNADGYLDIIALSGTTVYVSYGQEVGFAGSVPRMHNVDNFFYGDFDGNHLVDVVVQRVEPHSSEIIYNYQEDQKRVSLVDVAGKTLLVKDITGDGSPELIQYDSTSRTLFVNSLDTAAANPIRDTYEFQKDYEGDQLVAWLHVKDWYPDRVFFDQKDGNTLMYELDNDASIGRNHVFEDFQIRRILDGNEDGFVEFIGVSANGSLVVLNTFRRAHDIDITYVNKRRYLELKFEEREQRDAFMENGIISVAGHVRGGIGISSMNATDTRRVRVYLSDDLPTDEPYVISAVCSLGDTELITTERVGENLSLYESSQLQLVKTLPFAGTEVSNSTLLGYHGGSRVVIQQDELILQTGVFDRLIDLSESLSIDELQSVKSAHIGFQDGIASVCYLRLDGTISGTSFDDKLTSVDDFLVVIDGVFPEQSLYVQRDNTLYLETPTESIALGASTTIVDVCWIDNNPIQSVVVYDSIQSSLLLYIPIRHVDSLETEVVTLADGIASDVQNLRVEVDEEGILRNVFWEVGSQIYTLSGQVFDVSQLPIDNVKSTGLADMNNNGMFELIVVDEEGSLVQMHQDNLTGTWQELKRIEGQEYTHVAIGDVDVLPYRDVLAYRADGTVDWYSNSYPRLLTDIDGDRSRRHVSHTGGYIKILRNTSTCHVSTADISVFTEFSGTIDSMCVFVETEDVLRIDLPDLIAGDNIHVELYQTSCSFTESDVYRIFSMDVVGEQLPTSRLFTLYNRKAFGQSFGLNSVSEPSSAVGWIRTGTDVVAMHYQPETGFTLRDTLFRGYISTSQSDGLFGSYGERRPGVTLMLEDGFQLLDRNSASFMPWNILQTMTFGGVSDIYAESKYPIPLFTFYLERPLLIAKRDSENITQVFETIPRIFDVDADGDFEFVFKESIENIVLIGNPNENEYSKQLKDVQVIPVHIDKNRTIDYLVYDTDRRQLRVELRGENTRSAQTFDIETGIVSTEVYDLNGDGFDEIFINLPVNVNSILWSNDFGEYELVTDSVINSFTTLRFKDITYDGIAELFVLHAHSLYPDFRVLTTDGNIVSVPSRAANEEQLHFQSVVAHDTRANLVLDSDVESVTISNVLGQTQHVPYKVVDRGVSLDVSHVAPGVYLGVVKTVNESSPMYFSLLVE